jgi:hypothetical protein
MIRHVHEVDASHHFEEFTENVISGTDAARRHVDLAGIDFGIGDETRTHHTTGKVMHSLKNLRNFRPIKEP